VAKTWAPVGCTPILRHSYKRDRLSVISGISVSPKRRRLGLYYRIHANNIGQAQVCEFLRALLRHLKGKVIVLMDNSTTHRGGQLRQLLATNERLSIEYFPSYAPEINPDEGIWSLTKRRLANHCPRDIPELHGNVDQCLWDIGSSPHLLRGCIANSKLSLFLP
jgi:transposase